MVLEIHQGAMVMELQIVKSNEVILKLIKSMDLNKFYNEKHINHWAEELEPGDKCLATIRHKTDGSKNLHNIEIIVIENELLEKRIMGYFKRHKKSIPYNDLRVYKPEL